MGIQSLLSVSGGAVAPTNPRTSLIPGSAKSGYLAGLDGLHRHGKRISSPIKNEYLFPPVTQKSQYERTLVGMVA